MKIAEVIHAHGHENILSTHMTTFEITKDSCVTKRGDCIIAVGATKGAVDFSPEFQELARRENAHILIKIEAGGIVEIVNAKGTRRLLFTHPTDMVIRRSAYVCDRTVAIEADKAAIDLSRRLVEKLQNSKQQMKMTLTVESSNLGVDNHLPSIRSRGSNSSC